MISNLALRLATRDDAPGIARLSRDRIEHGLGWSWTAPRVLRSILDAQTNVVVAHDGADPIGFGIMKYHDDEAHLLLLAVPERACRRGVGSALVAWLERSALVAGVGQVYLEARITNAPARAFYARLGYREVQTLPGYYAGREACVRLAKDLWLVPAER
jgi:[ribosomal protein S18]-alanine N-acetyltransferase